MLERYRGQLARRGFTWWPWRERSSDELVGLVGLNAAEVEGKPAVEVGWSIVPTRWGEGLATEAARASLDWGFERCALDEVVSFTMVDNERSRRVMEKLGLEYVRDFDHLGLPHVLYRARRPLGQVRET
ncbi:MAG: acetyltransferase, ribosomal protein N-acetylase [Solirubrobacterales bacterium]|jgi:RimJ/RimL family protein N-acetyltransferase|nr:acetyltransferase, ribosomal protein N-acetylase [Solirubrobacterales bacterium]